MSIEKRLERVEAILDARGLDWDHPRVEDGHSADASKMVAKEPALDGLPDIRTFAQPNLRWRILRPDEIVQGGDWMNARQNSQEVGPPDGGWLAAPSFYFGKEASVSFGLYFARPVTEKPRRGSGEAYRLLSKEQLEDFIPFGDFGMGAGILVASDHFAGANKMVVEEQPKKWRILEPGEVVCSSDLVNAKLNPPSDPPNGLGWIPVIASVGATVCEDDPGIFARPVVDELPATEPGPDPAGPKPDPGEGYRILGKDPPEDLTPGDEFEVWNGKWIRSSNAETTKKQGAICRYRRKIEVAKEPEPAWEPKVGDWVLVTRPVDWIEWEHPCWAPQMHQFDGKVGKIESEREGRFHICGFAWHGLRFVFHRDWLSPAEPPAKEEPPEPEYRQPVLPGDCGKRCEFSDDSISWEGDDLIGWRANLNTFNWESACDSYRYARIKKDA